MSAEPVQSTEVVQHVEAAPVASQSASIISVIERAALNPDVDIDKMERLLEMHERIMEREGKGAYFAALSEMQPKLPVVGRRGTIRVPSKDGKTGHETPYALWEDVNEAIRPFLAEHGFSLSFRVKKEADRVEVTGILGHRGGHSEETMLSLPMDSTGSKNNVQAIGSSVSYGKRYTAFALLNITSRGEDDDGKAAGDPAISGAAEAAINALTQLKTKPALAKWRSDNDAMIRKLDRNDFAAVRRAFDAHQSSIGAGQ